MCTENTIFYRANNLSRSVAGHGSFQMPSCRRPLRKLPPPPPPQPQPHSPQPPSELPALSEPQLLLLLLLLKQEDTSSVVLPQPGIFSKHLCEFPHVRCPFNLISETFCRCLLLVILLPNTPYIAVISLHFTALVFEIGSRCRPRIIADIKSYCRAYCPQPANSLKTEEN